LRITIALRSKTFAALESPDKTLWIALPWRNGASVRQSGRESDFFLPKTGQPRIPRVNRSRLQDRTRPHIHHYRFNVGFQPERPKLALMAKA
jgi:hypothetical protein